MIPQPDNIVACLDRYPALTGQRRYVVAFSGGLDSTVLLDLIRRALPRRNGASLLAVHVDHGLHPSSQGWSDHSAAVARQFGVDYESCTVRVDSGNGESPEAAARAARYEALTGHIGPGDVLLTAHHRDDQIETVLLQLMRGAGVAGLAGIPELAAFAGGWCLRPLLGLARSDLLAYAQQHRLQWLDDPGNTDQRFGRNFLRHEIVPALIGRWPGMPASVVRSAKHCAAATTLLRETGAQDAALIAAAGSTVNLELLRTLSNVRQDNALRYWLQREGMPSPDTAHLQQIRQLIEAAGAAGCVNWHGVELRRYRERLYAMPALAQVPANYSVKLATNSIVTLPAGLGRLRCALTPGGGLAPNVCGDNLIVRFRAGGEKIRPAGSTHRRDLRNLFQEAGIVPWMRDRIPMVYAGDRLAAVADLWFEQELSAGPGSGGLEVRWEDHPPLY